MLVDGGRWLWGPKIGTHKVLSNDPCPHLVPKPSQPGAFSKFVFSIVFLFWKEFSVQSAILIYKCIYICIHIPVSRNASYPIRSRFRVAPAVSSSKYYIYRNTSFVLTHWAARNCRSIRVVWPMPSFVPGWIWQYKDGQNMHPVRSKFAKLLKNSLGLAWHSPSAQSPSQSNGIRKSIL